MNHYLPVAEIPAQCVWDEGPIEPFLADAAVFNRDRDSFESQLQVATDPPEGAVRLTDASRPWPINRAVLLQQALEGQYKLSLAKAPTEQGHEQTWLYVDQEDAAAIAAAEIYPNPIYATSAFLTRRVESAPAAYERVIRSIEQESPFERTQVLKPGTLYHQGALQQEVLGENAGRILQRSFMTTYVAQEGLNPDFEASLPTGGAESYGRMVRRSTAGLYGIMHEQGMRPFSIAELQELALRSVHLQALSRLPASVRYNNNPL